ncbi:auxin-responsive protein SAUR68-like [Pistacia vera]|uniref:auxin-responsive protein SAUR68-like n=1 Tax=Pistacia vera TaxID=55513 RepID=UPI001262D076|nr:auxin-responsive protein SAUR68-like [Pistacia vera]
MISPKKSTYLKKLKKMGKGEKRMYLLRTNEELDVHSANKPSVAGKGHFVVYTTDQKRFEIPLLYLNNNIFLELLKVSEEEFGISSDGPITLACDAVSMDYTVSLIKHGADKGSEKAFIDYITASHCTSSSATFLQEFTGNQSLVCGC